ncbi:MULTISPECIES: hypothetical protein [unclassified Polaribacter]|uniref:hypothetical protein n=1 Tax=unclassified Polaribacter TaxID=196858 RepID=UPI0011BED0B5|nr:MULTISPECIES: hypothetical protein [unclassified Polaribacter]TXD47369.1 hypothetical protein ES043_18315 [Polaribacter sp. IC063]TXD55335.1 hypothetical protein ES044_18100 [Polaribacter sp. IC066]
MTLEVYRKVTEDLLLSPEISGVTGAYSPGNYGGSRYRPTVNAGNVENKGLEFQISYNDNFSKNFSFNTSFNVSTVENKVLFVASENGFEQGGSFGITGSFPSRMEAGLPLGYFYGYRVLGVFQSNEEVTASAITNEHTSMGDLKFADLSGPDGTSDGVIDEYDRTYLGDPIPDVTLGFNIGFNYKNIDFSTSLYASIGNDMIRDYEHRDEPLTNRGAFLLDRWSLTNQESLNPKVSLVQTPSTRNFSDYFVEDASYLRIQNIQIGYFFAQDWVRNTGIDKLRVYATMNNLYTFTNYSGFDPSASSGNPIGAGIDKGFYPLARTCMLGLNLKF